MTMITRNERPLFADRVTTRSPAESRSTSSASSPLGITRPSKRLVDRNSFSSVKEDDCGIAQSFTDTKQSSIQPALLTTVGPAAEERISNDTMATALLTQAPAFCCPCGQFKGWKEVHLKGRGLSRSYGDLRLLGGDWSKGWEWGKTPQVRSLELPPVAAPVIEPPPKKVVPTTYPPGHAPLEMLPAEILDQILPLLALDLPPNGFTHRNVDLVSCLLTSRTMHAATLTTLYRRITIPHSLIFSKFLKHITQYPALGTVVRRLDFSHFSSVGLGRTRRMNSELQMVTGSTLYRCLSITPRLQEFLVQEHLDDDLDEFVIGKLFTSLPLLRALDFCGCSSSAFKATITSVISPTNLQLPLRIDIQRLSLHECTTLPASLFETLLPRLHRLTHLDLGHTQVTDAALASIPQSAQLTHLNLTRCTRISGPRTVQFLTGHPAVATSLVYLNLLADISRYRLLSQDDVEALLPRLPNTLRALNLSGAKIISSHVPLLLPLTKHLEELSLGYSELSLDDLNDLFVPKASLPTDPSGLSKEELAWIPPALHYLDLTCVAAITPGRLFSTNSVLLRPMTLPLEVLEVGEKVLSGLRERGSTPSRRLGWVVRELGRRGWFVREPRADFGPDSRDSGRRTWKMGAMWWGMRKIPVAGGEVGGLYGHYMFKK